MLLPTFKIRNREHDGTEISTITPVGESLTWSYPDCAWAGPGKAGWQVALSDANLGRDDFAPRRTDWELIMTFGVDETILSAGIMLPVNMHSDPATGTWSPIACQGETWLAYLRQPWPFSYENVASDQAANQLNDIDELWKYWSSLLGATQQDVIDDIFNSISGYEDYIEFVASYEGTGWTETLDKEVAFGDDTTMLDIILAVAGLGAPKGFSVWDEADKTVVLTSPTVTDPDDVTPIYTLDSSNIVVPPLDWTNNGPLESDTVVMGTGRNTRRIGFSKYQGTRDQYRRWVRLREVELSAEDTIASSAAALGYRSRFPHKDLKITIRPDLLDPDDITAGFLRMTGQPIRVNYDVAPYHEIDAEFLILNQEFRPQQGAAGWLCDLTLWQLYGTSSDPTP